MTLIDYLQKCYEQHPWQRPFIVALDGLGGAGKTTIAKKCAQMCDHAVVIHMDDHIVERKKRYATGHESWYEYYFLQWDVRFLKTHLFEKLYQSTEQLCLPFYYQQDDRLVLKELSIPKKAMVIIEGIFLLRDEWRPYYDVAIYIDCPKAVREQRVLARDTYLGDRKAILEKYQTRYWPAEDYYIATQKPHEKADFVIPCHEIMI